MAASPCWKVFNPQGEYVASCKHAEDAAALVATLGRDAKVSWKREVWVWHEGREAAEAIDSYDTAADLMRERFEVFASARIMGGAQTKSPMKESTRCRRLISPRFPSF